MKVKNKKKLKKEQVKYPVFSFQYIDLSSKQFSIEYFQKNKGLPIVSVFGSLFDKLKRISSVPILDLADTGKVAAFETLSYSQFDQKLQNLFRSVQLAPDAKLTVFRFCQQKCRLICSSDDNIFYILAFDFNFSAYDHG